MLWVDYSFSLALCTENKCFPTIYYVLVGLQNLGIPLSDTSKSMVKRKLKVRPLIIKLLLSLWLLLRIIYNYYNYYYYYYYYSQFWYSVCGPVLLADEHCCQAQPCSMGLHHRRTLLVCYTLCLLVCHGYGLLGLFSR